MLRRVATSVWILLFAPLLGAQVRGGPPSPGFNAGPAHPTAGAGRGIRGGSGEFHPRPRFRGNLLVLGSPYLYDYADYLSEPVPPQPVPQVVTVSAAPAAVPAPAPPEPVLLERRGDTWVRVSLSDLSVVDTTAGGPAQPPSVRVPGRKMQPPALEQPPAVLIFADGRKQEVSRYTIIGNVLYTDANYWTTGSWTKKVLVSSLNLPATLQANQERGVKFILPSGPNEVVVRP